MTLNAATIQLFQSIQNPALTSFFKFVSIITEPILISALMIAISAILYLKKQKSKAILLALTSISAAAIVEILKEAIHSPRPLTGLIKETSYSFPSGHTTIAIIFCGLMVYIFSTPKTRLKATLIAVPIVFIVALSRLYLQVHWLTDIIGGIVVGTTILTISIITHKKLTN